MAYVSEWIFPNHAWHGWFGPAAGAAEDRDAGGGGGGAEAARRYNAAIDFLTQAPPLARRVRLAFLGLAPVPGRATAAESPLLRCFEALKAEPEVLALTAYRDRGSGLECCTFNPIGGDVPFAQVLLSATSAAEAWVLAEAADFTPLRAVTHYLLDVPRAGPP